MTKTAKRLWYVVMFLWGAVIASYSATSFSGRLMVQPSWTHEKTGITTASESFSSLLNWSHTSGTNANQMNQIWRDRRTLTNSEAQTIDIAGGITNAFGDALTMAEVRMLAVILDSDQANSISIGGAASQAFDTWVGDSSDKVVVRPGGLFLLVGPDATGYAVSTNSNLKVTNDGTNSVQYDIYVGASSQ